MSHEVKPTCVDHPSDESELSDAAHDLIPSLWILICTFLEPFERFRVGATCKVLHASFSFSSYPIYTFYASDVGYWTRHMQWMLSSIRVKHQPRSSRSRTHLPFYALNLYAFDDMSKAQRLNCKYFLIWYHKLCALRVNQKIERHEHLLRIKDEQEHQMARLSDTDDESNGGGGGAYDDYHHDDNADAVMAAAAAAEEKERQLLLLEEELQMLQIDRDALAAQHHAFIPTTIVHLYMHELMNSDQSVMRWTCDCIRHCSSDRCTIFRDLHFDKSHLDNTSIDMLCNTLLRRPQPFSCLRSIFFSGNVAITDGCVSLLLRTLYSMCDSLVYIDLDRTGITNETCRILYEFYTEFLACNDVASIQQKLPPWQYIDLSNNIIDIRGVDMINDMFVKFARFNVKNAATAIDGDGGAAAAALVPLELEVDVANCNWSIARVTWSDRILYDI